MRKKGLGQGLGLEVLLALTLLVTTSYSLLVTNSLAEEEEFTITTYYPSPYGSYNELSTNKFAVGDTNGDGNLTSADQPNKVGNIRLKPQANLPQNWDAGKEGEIAYSSTEDTLYVNNGSSWVAQGGGGGTYTAYGTTECASGWTKAYSGYITFGYLSGTGAAGVFCHAQQFAEQAWAGLIVVAAWAQGGRTDGSTTWRNETTSPQQCAVCVK